MVSADGSGLTPMRRRDDRCVVSSHSPLASLRAAVLAAPDDAARRMQLAEEAETLRRVGAELRGMAAPMYVDAEGAGDSDY